MTFPGNKLSPFTRSLWLTLCIFIVFAIIFAIYVHSEKQIDRANELRLQSYLLADELRQSSDDLTQMVRSYVVSGDPIYKQHFQEILDIRDGRKPRPVNYEDIYWDLVLSDNKRPRPNEGHAIALLERMRQAGFTKAEFAKLAQAKANSDVLTSTEFAAMKLVESTNPPTEANRIKASLMLHDVAYRQAKAAIMQPISEFYQLSNKRTLDAVHAAEELATLVRGVFILFGLLLLFMLWHAYRALHAALGEPLDKLYQHIMRIANGDFSSPISVAKGKEDSVFGWLSVTQHKLAEIDAERKDAEARNQRLTQFYATLSQCNQAIVRCKSEEELFPQICLDAVTFGGMKMAWIGLLDEQSKQLKPVASYGSGTEYLEGLLVVADAANPLGRGPTGTALLENRPFWCQDFQHDPATAPWKDRAVLYGWGSSASLPLHRNETVIGALTLYSPDANAFDEAVRNLLLEMVTDIDYALNSFEHEARRKQAENEWHKLSQVVEQSPNAIIITDLNSNIEYVNEAFVTNTGYSVNEVIGKQPSLLSSGKTPDATYMDMWAHMDRGESWQGELVNRRKDGSEYIDLMKMSPIRQDDGHITHYMAIKEDISERKRAEEHIQYLANFDALTGLPNRAQLDDRAKYAISIVQRSQGSLALMFLDLDNFKDINDTLGHTVGDALLIELAKRLQLVLREEDTLSRLGGDEFILLLPGTDALGAAHVAQKLLDDIAEPYRIDQHELNLTASIGIALYPGDGEDLETLSKSADTAMYRVKQEGRRGYRFFTAEMQARSARNLQLGNALRHALNRNQLQVYYQPQLSMRDGRIIGAEALLRWQHPELGAVSPAEFIPVAEDSGLILPIGEWVLRQAVRQVKVWMEGGLAPLVMAVNLSAMQFRHPDLPDLVARILDEVGLPPEYLELELTEGVAMHDPQAAIAVMNNLHDRGVRMSIDDFGTGYSSLSYLKKFKVYKLKIDQSFVRDISTDPEDKAIVSAIIHMAKSLGLKTIAEGVETEGQLAFLQEQECDEVQGYYFSKPVPAEQFEAFARSRS